MSGEWRERSPSKPRVTDSRQRKRPRAESAGFHLSDGQGWCLHITHFDNVGITSIHDDTLASGRLPWLKEYAFAEMGDNRTKDKDTAATLLNSEPMEGREVNEEL
jgi:hypothetical protein